MEISEQPRLRFNGIDILRVNFNARKPVKPGDTNINLSVVPHVLYPRKAPATFKIFVEVNAKREDYFDLELVAIGHFETDREIDEEIKKTLVNQNAVAILFPYIRSFITTFTGNLGSVVEPIIIPVQFFKGDIDVMADPEENNQIESQQLELPSAPTVSP
jgi:preprotein translocase subunit SecB